MPSKFRPSFHSSLAKRIVDDVYYNRTSLYFFIGRTQSWPEYVDLVDPEKDDPYCNCTCHDKPVADSLKKRVEYGDAAMPPPCGDDSDWTENQIRNDIIYIHKIKPDDITLVARAFKWQSGNVYTQYDNRRDMVATLETDSPFYVYNSEYNVYKCLYNNKTKTQQGFIYTPSTEEPKGINYDVIETSDGYMWKYMYTIPSTLRNRYLTPRFMPISNAVTQQFYTKGTIEDIIVIDPGENYSEEAKTVAYVDRPPEEGTRAKIQLYIDKRDGSISHVEIVDRGSGYDEDEPPRITIDDLEGTGRGKYGNKHAILKARIKDGKLDTVVIEDCGENYPYDSNTSLIVNGDGVGFVGYPIIVNGQITGVKVVDGGKGYSFAECQAYCVKNRYDVKPAKFKVVVGGAMKVNDQSIVEQTSKKGGIYAIEITDMGGEYTSSVSAIIEGDGYGARAHCEVDNGHIIKVIMDDFGHGYTTARVKFVDPGRKEPTLAPVAKAYPILPPLNGHGHDAVGELYTNTVATFVKVRNNVLLRDLGQEFRQSGLIENLRTIDTSTLVRSSENLIDFEVKIDNPVTFSDNIGGDSIFTINDTEYRVIQKISKTQYKLQQLSQIFREVQVGDIIDYVDPTNQQKMSFTINEIVKSPNVDKYSGDMYYVSNDAPFYMEENKTFGLRTFIEL